jgi:hypothetical protein
MDEMTGDGGCLNLRVGYVSRNNPYTDPDSFFWMVARSGKPRKILLFVSCGKGAQILGILQKYD